MYPKFAVIIPVYNGEQYVEECLKSLIAQRYTNWVAICVNDGSKDNSLSELAKFSQIDERIIIFDSPNGGVSKARNFALKSLENYSYDWIVFLDIDDILSPFYFENLAKAINSNGCEDAEYIRSHISYAKTREEMHNIKEKSSFVNGRYEVMSAEEYFSKGDVGGIISTCIIKKNIFNKFKILMDEGIKLMEDQVFSISYALKSKSIIKTESLGYIYYSPIDNERKYRNKSRDITLVINRMWSISGGGEC